MALTSEEQELFDFASASMPRWFRESNRYFLSQCAKLFGDAREMSNHWLRLQSLIGQAVGASASEPDWLNQHAVDRGTRRQNGEVDIALRDRLRTVPEALSRESILEAAQALVTAQPVVGTVYMVELRREGAHFSIRSPDTGTGGTFTAPVSGNVTFDPTGNFSGSRPPYDQTPTVITRKIVISGAANAGNNGTFTISGIVLNSVQYANASGVAGADPTVSWRVDRYDQDNNLLTGGSGRRSAYLNRGYRMGRTGIVLILPFGTSEATRLAVLEMLRQKKAAGVSNLVERRQNP